ncbi:hypothetical protein FNF28_07394 [Cafeteria roenbergensis]|uniref:PH domain-containing protein n=1 Tax=Cafeteria roenbergensis TaxID=33653 RepID=A0A5A8C7I3_CAFRO|nr:hypothetical protein FNF28_07394 [Cafeteria roenbergensis]
MATHGSQSASDEPVFRRGWLYKAAKTGNKFRKRWAIMTSSGLVCQKDQHVSDGSAPRFIPIAGSVMRDGVPPRVGSPDFAFTIGCRSPARELFFHCSNAEDLQGWKDAFAAAQAAAAATANPAKKVGVAPDLLTLWAPFQSRETAQPAVDALILDGTVTDYVPATAPLGPDTRGGEFGLGPGCTLYLHHASLGDRPVMHEAPMPPEVPPTPGMTPRASDAESAEDDLEGRSALTMTVKLGPNANGDILVNPFDDVDALVAGFFAECQATGEAARDAAGDAAAGDTEHKGETAADGSALPVWTAAELEDEYGDEMRDSVRGVQVSALEALVRATRAQRDDLAAALRSVLRTAEEEGVDCGASAGVSASGEVGGRWQSRVAELEAALAEAADARDEAQAELAALLGTEGGAGADGGKAKAAAGEQGEGGGGGGGGGASADALEGGAEDADDAAEGTLEEQVVRLRRELAASRSREADAKAALESERQKREWAGQIAGAREAASGGAGSGGDGGADAMKAVLTRDEWRSWAAEKRAILARANADRAALAEENRRLREAQTPQAASLEGRFRRADEARARMENEVATLTSARRRAEDELRSVYRHQRGLGCTSLSVALCLAGLASSAGLSIAAPWISPAEDIGARLGMPAQRVALWLVARTRHRLFADSDWRHYMFATLSLTAGRFVSLALLLVVGVYLSNSTFAFGRMAHAKATAFAIGAIIAALVPLSAEALGATRVVLFFGPEGTCGWISEESLVHYELVGFSAALVTYLWPSQHRGRVACCGRAWRLATFFVLLSSCAVVTFFATAIQATHVSPWAYVFCAVVTALANVSTLCASRARLCLTRGQSLHEGSLLAGARVLQHIALPVLQVGVMAYLHTTMVPDGCPSWARAGTRGSATGPDAGVAWPESVDASDPQAVARVLAALNRSAALEVATAILTASVCIGAMLKAQEVFTRTQAAASHAAEQDLRSGIAFVSMRSRGPLNAAALSLALLRPGGASGSHDIPRADLLRELRASVQRSKRHLDGLLLWGKASAKAAADVVPAAWGRLDDAWGRRICSGFLGETAASGRRLSYYELEDVMLVPVFSWVRDSQRLGGRPFGRGFDGELRHIVDVAKSSATARIVAIIGTLVTLVLVWSRRRHLELAIKAKMLVLAVAVLGGEAGYIFDGSFGKHRVDPIMGLQGSCLWMPLAVTQSYVAVALAGIFATVFLPGPSDAVECRCWRGPSMTARLSDILRAFGGITLCFFAVLWVSYSSVLQLDATSSPVFQVVVLSAGAMMCSISIAGAYIIVQRRRSDDPVGLDPQDADVRERVYGSLYLTAASHWAGCVIASFVAVVVFVQAVESDSRWKSKAATAASRKLRSGIAFVSMRSRGPLNAAALSLALLRPGGASGSHDIPRADLLRELRASVQRSKRHLDGLLLWGKASAKAAADVVPAAWGRLDDAWGRRICGGFRGETAASGRRLSVSVWPVGDRAAAAAGDVGASLGGESRRGPSSQGWRAVCADEASGGAGSRVSPLPWLVPGPSAVCTGNLEVLADHDRLLAVCRNAVSFAFSQEPPPTDRLSSGVSSSASAPGDASQQCPLSSGAGRSAGEVQVAVWAEPDDPEDPQGASLDCVAGAGSEGEGAAGVVAGGSGGAGADGDVGGGMDATAGVGPVRVGVAARAPGQVWGGRGVSVGAASVPSRRRVVPLGEGAQSAIDSRPRGILRRSSLGDVLRMRSYMARATLVVAVADNGPGMDPEAVSSGSVLGAARVPVWVRLDSGAPAMSHFGRSINAGGRAGVARAPVGSLGKSVSSGPSRQAALGLRVEAFADGQDAVDRMRTLLAEGAGRAADGEDGGATCPAASSLPRLLVVDGSMPRLGGVGTLAAVRALRAEASSVGAVGVVSALDEMRAIAVTGDATSEGRRAFLEAGASSVIAKPVEAEVLLASLGDVLGSSSEEA